MTDKIFTTTGEELKTEKLVEQSVKPAPKLNRMEKLFKLEAITMEGDILYFVSDSRERIAKNHETLAKNKGYKTVKIFCGAQEITLERLKSL